VGSKSEDLLRQTQLNGPRGATFLPQNQDPTRAPAAQLGSSALPTDLLRPYQGYGGIRMWDYSGFSNYNALQTGVTRRYDRGLMFSFFYVWSKALGINNDDFTPGLPNASDAEVRRLDYSLLSTDRPHNFVQRDLQLPFLKDQDTITAKILGGWQLSGVYRWTGGTPQGVGSRSRASALQPDGQRGRLGARVVLTCDPGGLRRRPARAVQHGVLRPPQPGSDGAESRFFMRQPPINNWCFNVEFRRPEEPEVRVPRRRVQRPQPHAAHRLQRHGELREPDQHGDHQPGAGCQRERDEPDGVWLDQRRGCSAHPADRHPRDVLTSADDGPPGPSFAGSTGRCSARGTGRFLLRGTPRTARNSW
jgi:hypothetical protein